MSRLHARRQLVAAGLSIALAVPVAALAAPSALASGSDSSGFVLLAKGATGPRVAYVQRALGVKPVTKRYNDSTRHAVRRFQDARGLRATGVVNARTMDAVQRKWTRIQKARARVHHEYRRIMDVARNQKGDPYVYGAAGPNAFDCSGYTMFVYGRATNINLVHRASTQFREGTRISRKQARPGDLVFMYNSGGIYHASIYAGHGHIWEAARPGTSIHHTRIWTHNVYYARLLPRP